MERFAVRSSTLLEDGADASYAGMFETFLDVSPDDVWDAVEACVETTSSERVSAYQRGSHVETEEPDFVPVVVQQMVAATSAGVGFSVHPATERGDVMVIEAVHGLGDRLVSGRITPDLYEVHPVDGSVIKFEMGEQHGARGAALDRDQIIAVVELMRSMRAALGFEVDVEFAFEDNVLFALQVRAITTIAHAPAEVDVA